MVNYICVSTLGSRTAERVKVPGNIIHVFSEQGPNMQNVECMVTCS